MQGVNGPICVNPNNGSICNDCPTCSYSTGGGGGGGTSCTNPSAPNGGSAQCQCTQSCYGSMSCLNGSWTQCNCQGCGGGYCSGPVNHNCTGYFNLNLNPPRACHYEGPTSGPYGSSGPPPGCYDNTTGAYCGQSYDTQLNCSGFDFYTMSQSGQFGVQYPSLCCSAGGCAGLGYIQGGGCLEGWSGPPYYYPNVKTECLSSSDCSTCSSACGPGTQVCGNGRTYNPGPGAPTPDCSLVSKSCCTANCGWHCEQPLNGLEVDQCGNTRQNLACAPVYFQATGASVHSNGAITGFSDAFIPAGTYFNQLASGFYGIVSSGGSISFSPSKTNSKLWQLQNYPTAGGSILQNPKYDHNYFWNAFGDKVVTTINANQITSGDLQTSGTAPVFLAIHPISGNSVSIANPINIVGGKLLVVFVNSGADPIGSPVNLNLAPGGSVKVDSQSMIIWIVSGNVTIDPSISQADGYWLSSGTFNDGTGSTQLNISGGVAAYGGVLLGRHNSDYTKPSEVITYNPNIYLLAPVIGTSVYSWTEVSP